MRERVIDALYLEGTQPLRPRSTSEPRDMAPAQRPRRVPLAAILNPLGGKSYDPTTRRWDVSGIDPVGSVIVPHDFWCVDRADILVCNFLALCDGYPNIGTLCEFGRATKTGCLIYSIVKPGFEGHSQTAFKLHPFIERNSAALFPSIDACIDFLVRHLPVLSGKSPRFERFKSTERSQKPLSGPETNEHIEIPYSHKYVPDRPRRHGPVRLGGASSAAQHSRYHPGRRFRVCRAALNHPRDAPRA